MTDEPDRLRRAREEDLAIHQIGPDQYEVLGEDNSNYEIDLRTMKCDCPDFSTRDIDRCKHLYKGLLVTQGLDAEDVGD